LSVFGCVGASDAVGEFEHRQDGKGDSFVTRFQHYGFQKLAGVLALGFGGNGSRRVGHQFQTGGASGS
jgi:hypothetical protein